MMGMTLPAFAEGDPVPVTDTTASEEVVSPSESMRAQDASAAEPEPDEETLERPPVPAGAVARGTFATAIDEREPVDSITSLGSDRNRVYYFSEFVGISGRELTHRWEYRGEVMAEVPIAIGAPRWRTWSSKNLDASQLGEWTVSVVDESGEVVRSDRFVYEEAGPVPEIAAPTATPAAPAPAPAPKAAGETLDPAPASPAPAQPQL